MTRRAIHAVGAAALVAMAASGCTMGPPYQRPLVTVPDQYRDQPAPTMPESLADRAWGELLDDPALDQLIREALENNSDVRAAAARVEQARARAGITRSESSPQITGGVSVGRGKDPFEDASNQWQAHVGISWELDLWGRIKRLNEAARAQFLGTEAARRGVILSLVSDVATAYFRLRELDNQLGIARRTMAAFQETADLFNRKLQGGAASALETARAEAALNGIATTVPLIENQIAALENQISFLLGRAPGPIPRGPAPQTMTPPDVPAGLPSALLQRRPDIRQAEQAIVAANALVGAAHASFFPALSLTGVLGGASPELSSLFTDGRTWSIAGGVIGPVLNGGRLRKQKALAIAQWEESKVEYERVINAALAETASGLRAHQKLAEAEQQAAKAVAAYREAVRLSNLRYASGLSAYFEVLDAMSQLFPAELTLSSLQRDRLVNFAELYKALGGGWQSAGLKPPLDDRPY